MSGLMSRRKGMAGEYKVRDYFRSLGYTADRVPSSGAAEGFKGDVKVTKDSVSFLVEVKSRQNSFKSIYELFYHHAVTAFAYKGKLVDITNDFTTLLGSQPIYTIYEDLRFNRVFNKILNMEKLLKGCQYLVIKDNNKPLLFLRYR